MMKRLLLILVLLLSIFLVINSASAASKIVLNVEHDEPVLSLTHEILIDLSDKIYEMTDEQVKLEILPACSSSGGNIKTMIENVQMGALDAALIATSIFSSWDPKLDVLHLPFLFSDIKELEKIGRYSPELKEIYKTYENKYSLTIVDAWARALRQVVNEKKKIEKVEDFKGLKLRVPEITLWQDAFKALGVKTVVMPFSEIPTSIALGLIDGAERPTEFLKTENWWDLAKYVTMTNHTGDVLIFAFNNRSWNKLNQSQKDILVREIKAAGDVKREREIEMEIEVMKLLKEKGMEVNILGKDERKKIKDIMKETWQKHSGNIGESLFDSVLKRLEE